MPDSPAAWLLLVAAAHAGFQLTVDLVVYPALYEVPDDGWAAAHAAHSRRITPLVVLLYPALVGTVLWTLSVRPGAGAWVAALGAALAVGATAASAAPAHRRLSSATAEDRPSLLRTLLLADRVRTAGALVCLAGAVLTVG